jgi:ADP-ribose pyrophosphatase YjhB (NUDIX family)
VKRSAKGIIAQGEDMNLRDFVYCPYCGTPLVARDLFQRMRPACPACGFIHFRDPKVAVIGLVTWRDHVLLIRRGVDPQRGKWALPGGYMDAGEMPTNALARELREEVGLDVAVHRLLDIFPMAGPGVVNGGIVLAFHASAAAPESPPLACDDDVSEAAWFSANVLPLPDDLAFESTITLLAQWRRGLAQNPR